jgi:hypothetical protein
LQGLRLLSFTNDPTDGGEVLYALFTSCIAVSLRRSLRLRCRLRLGLRLRRSLRRSLHELHRGEP